MGRGKLTEVTSRKDYPASDVACGDAVRKGERSFVLEAFRRKARYCAKHRPTEAQVRRFGGQSRADRAGDAATDLRDVASTLNELAEAAQEIARKLGEANEPADNEGDAVVRGYSEFESDVREIIGTLETLSIDASEVESLAEEMRSWADNMEGAETNLESTSKYSEVDEAASTLEDISFDDALPTLSSKPTEEELEAFAEEAESLASDLENAAEELDSVKFQTAF